MAVTTANIRQAVADRIQSSCGINAFPFDIDSVSPPYAVVLAGAPYIEYWDTFGDVGRAHVNLIVEVRTVAAEALAAQRNLAPFVDAGTGATQSVFTALMRKDTGQGSPNLSGAVEGIHVESVSLNSGAPLPDGKVEFAAQFQVTVLARKD